MMRISRLVCWVPAVAGMVVFALSAGAQVKPDLYAGLKWRNVGPFHGGRISSVTGVIGQPGVFYFGAPQGGIWKTTSAGVTWFPIFDEVQMNMVASGTTAGPHGPQVIPGVYTLKLTMDGQVYTRHAIVMNDPRVGENPKLMADLRAQNQTDDARVLRHAAELQRQSGSKRGERAACVHDERQAAR